MNKGQGDVGVGADSVQEILTQAEVESLLGAMPSAKAQPADDADRLAQGPSAGSLPTDVRPKIMAYDFKRPERVGKEQMRALQSLHEGFGRNFGAALSALVRCLVEVKLTSVDQLTYSEFVFSLETPTCFHVIRAQPLEGNFILDINPSILFPMIDRLLGGRHSSGPVVRRPLTDIELRLVSRITRLLLEELQRAWDRVLDLSLAVERVESHPQLVQIVLPNEVVVLISFELAMGDVRGMMNLCIPFHSIEQLTSRLAATSGLTSRSAMPTAQSAETIRQRLAGSQVQVVVTLAESKLRTADLLGLRVGDIITTETDSRSLVDVQVQGVTKFHARPGLFKGQKAIQIESSLAR
jgi:flagellar motor switch protein FliM